MSSSAEREKAKEAKKKKEELEAKRRAYRKKCDPATVEEMLGGKDLEKDYFKEGQWKPSWAHLEFNADACLSNILKNKESGFYVPAGSMLPLGAQMQEMTVIKYGGYFPEGTSFPGGVMVPMHARMVNLLPKETEEKPKAENEESMCLLQ
nr:hypothetical protein L203_00248 [Cryptococcus depauperatus CBS 7841]